MFASSPHERRASLGSLRRLVMNSKTSLDHQSRKSTTQNASRWSGSSPVVAAQSDGPYDQIHAFGPHMATTAASPSALAALEPPRDAPIRPTRERRAGS